MTSTTITISTEGRTNVIAVDDIDFDTKRDGLALSLGRAIVDTIYTQVEGR